MKISNAEFEQMLAEILGRQVEAEQAEMPSSEELAKLMSFSPKHERRMRKLFRNPQAYVRNYRRPIYKKALRMAASILIAVSLLFGTLMAIPPARAFIMRIIQTWFDDHNRYTFTEPGAVVGDWTFWYIPEGFSLLNEFDDGLETFCIYADENNDMLFIEIFGSDMGVHIDNENFVYYEVEFNNVKADIYESTADNFHDIVILKFEDENTIIKLTGAVDLSELILIAENITKN